MSLPPSSSGSGSVTKASFKLGIITVSAVALGFLIAYTTTGKTCGAGIILLLPVGILSALAAIVLGIAHLWRTRRHKQRQTGTRQATWGILIGVVSLGAITVIAGTIPLWLDIQTCGDEPVQYHEPPAVQALRTLNTVEVTYASTYITGYSATLEQLGRSKDGVPSASHAGLVDDELAAGVKSGYRFKYVTQPDPTTGRFEKFQIYADPADGGASGERHYFTDESAVIRVTTENRPANAQDMPLAG
jgi:hypothetical protein